jgi:hypothetical protein
VQKQFLVALGVACALLGMTTQKMLGVRSRARAEPDMRDLGRVR